MDGLAAPEVYVRRPAPPRAPPAPAAASLDEALLPSVEESLPPGQPASTVDMALLHSQVVKARKASGQARRQLADAINAAFRRLGQSGGSRAVADFLLKQLEEDAFAELSDSEGRSCRSVAVEALLAMGYPYALEISPEDLEHLRQDANPGGMGAYGVAGLALAAVGAGVEATQALAHPQAPGSVAGVAELVHVAAIVATALVGALGKRGTEGWQLALTLLVVAGLAGVPLYLTGTTPAAVGGLCALIAAMLLSRRT